MAASKICVAVVFLFFFFTEPMFLNPGDLSLLQFMKNVEREVQRTKILTYLRMQPVDKYLSEVNNMDTKKRPWTMLLCLYC